MKRKMTLFLLISLMILLTACNKDGESTATTVGEEQQTQEEQSTEDESQSDALQTDTAPATVSLSEEEKKERYLAFVSGTEKAIADFDFLEGGLKSGQEYDYSAVLDAVLEAAYPFEGCKSSFYFGKYALIDFAGDGSTQLVIKLAISDSAIGQDYLFFDCINGQVHLREVLAAGINTDVYLNDCGILSVTDCYDCYYENTRYYKLNSDTRQEFLYEECAYGNMSRAWISPDEIAKEDRIEGYELEEYPYTTDDANAVMAYAYSFMDSNAVTDELHSDYLRSKFFAFRDIDGQDVSLRKYEQSIYDEMGLDIVKYSDAEKRVAEQLKTLGLTGESVNDKTEPEWQNLDSLGSGMVQVSEFGPSGMMKLLPGKWLYTIPNSATDMLEALYLEINQDATFAMNIIYKDPYSAPQYAKGHIKFARKYIGDMYPTGIYFEIEEHNITLYDEIDWLGVFDLEKMLQGEGKADLTLQVVEGNFSFFKDQYGDDHPNFVSELNPANMQVPYIYLLQPEETFFADDSSCSTDQVLHLEETSVKENDVTDEERWFTEVGMTDPEGRPIETGDYIIRLGGNEGYTKTVLKMYDRESGALERVFDLHEFMYARGYGSNSYVDRGIWYAQVDDNKLYLNYYHRTYAASCPENAYVMCIDLDTNEIAWISDPLSSNSYNFLIIDDTILTGYGFSAEDHYLSLIDKHSGTSITRIPVKKSPEYFCKKGNTIYVRTYSYDYEFSIME